MTSATGLFQLLLSPLLSRSAMAFFLLLFFLCTVLFFKSRGRPGQRPAGPGLPDLWPVHPLLGLRLWTL